VPHLDVIVEDEQLSLAIGKRGQNVRLASELINARIDIKSESDVKDEVADALARMLDAATGPSAAQAAAEAGISAIEGVTPELAERLEAAGLADPEAVLAGGQAALTEVEGVSPELADALLAWAEEQKAARAEAASAGRADIGQTFRRPEATSSMADEDFMAALSRAFQESEQQRASQAQRDAPAEPAEIADPAEIAGEGAGSGAGGEAAEQGSAAEQEEGGRE